MEVTGNGQVESLPQYIVYIALFSPPVILFKCDFYAPSTTAGKNSHNFASYVTSLCHTTMHVNLITLTVKDHSYFTVVCSLFLFTVYNYSHSYCMLPSGRHVGTAFVSSDFFELSLSQIQNFMSRIISTQWGPLTSALHISFFFFFYHISFCFLSFSLSVFLPIPHWLYLLYTCGIIEGQLQWLLLL